MRADTKMRAKQPGQRPLPSVWEQFASGQCRSGLVQSPNAPGVTQDVVFALFRFTRLGGVIAVQEFAARPNQLGQTDCGRQCDPGQDVRGLDAYDESPIVGFTIRENQEGALCDDLTGNFRSLGVEPEQIHRLLIGLPGDQLQVELRFGKDRFCRRDGARTVQQVNTQLADPIVRRAARSAQWVDATRPQLSHEAPWARDCS